MQQAELSKAAPVFTTDWFSNNIPALTASLASVRDRPVRFLEIGSWEGRSTLWFLQHLHELSTFSCVDTFRGGVEHQGSTSLVNLRPRFESNLADHKKRVTVFEGKSHEIVRTLPLDHYDVVYVDGSHEAPDVFIDTALVWLVTKPGGIIMFDDYGGGQHGESPAELKTSPKRAVDAFLAVFKGRVELIHNGYQIHVKKLQ
jgi:predicted O-methyltransferase YrrM